MQSTAVITQTTHKNLVLHIAGAALFGALILYAVGFLPTHAAHNAAHDTRHSFAFPCH